MRCHRRGVMAKVNQNSLPLHLFSFANQRSPLVFTRSYGHFPLSRSFLFFSKFSPGSLFGCFSPMKFVYSTPALSSSSIFSQKMVFDGNNTFSKPKMWQLVSWFSGSEISITYRQPKSNRKRVWSHGDWYFCTRWKRILNGRFILGFCGCVFFVSPFLNFAERFICRAFVGQTRTVTLSFVLMLFTEILNELGCFGRLPGNILPSSLASSRGHSIPRQNLTREPTKWVLQQRPETSATLQFGILLIQMAQL